MTHYHYLKFESVEPSLSLSELSERISAAMGDPTALSACARELARHAWSVEAEKLAAAVGEGLQDWMNDRPLPGSYPLPAAEAAQWGQLAAGWRALAGGHGRWIETAGRAVTGAVVDALHCLRQVVMVAGLTHWPVPEGLWLDVHALYRLGLEAGCAQKKIRKGFLRHHSRTTLEGEYVQILLLGLTDPWRQLPREWLALDSMVEKWAPLLALRTDGGEGWYVEGSRDLPAEWRQGGEGVRLDLAGLLAFLDDHEELASSLGRFEWVAHPDTTVSRALLAYWRRIWSHLPEPVAEIPTADVVELEVGLDAIFDRCRGERMSGVKVVATGRGMWQVTGRPLQIGDLMAVFDAGGREITGLGVVSRIEGNGPDDPSVGIQLQALHGKVVPVAVQPLVRSAQPCACQRGLLLHGEGEPTLLLAWQPFREGGVVRLLAGDKTYPVTLTSRRNPARDIMACLCGSAAGRFQK